jgi:hypothetical protein
MKTNFRFVFSVAALVALFAVSAFAQRTTGDIEGTVTDPKGAVVPGVTVTVTGVSVGFERTVQTNSEGRYKINSVPAGTYRVTTAAVSGFAENTINNISVNIEKSTFVDVTLGITQNVNTVEVSGDPLGVSIDPSDSKVQTTITRALIEKLPTGASVTSLLKISPATRQEPLSGGFQVDGASGSENSFLVDGQPLENFRTGVLNSVNNIPTSLVSEVQIKTGGFEAEHGGASGGVISIATRSGADVFHGDFGSSFDVAQFNPAPRFSPARFVSSSSSPAAIAANPDYVYAIAQPKDDYLNVFPTAVFSGPVVKKHIWFIGSYSPQIFETNRTSRFYNALANSNFSTGSLVLTPRPTQLDPIEYRVKQTFNYAFGRIDATFFDKLRGTVSYLWNPSVTEGNTPFAAISTSNPVNTVYGGVSYPSGEYAKLQGGRTNANTFSSQLTWTPTSKLVVNGRYGRSFLNEKAGNYALPNEPRYVCGGDQTAYGTIATNCPGGRGFQNLTTNTILTRDVSVKNEINADASYLVGNFGGSHEFKGGYQWGRITNDVLTGNASTGTVTLFYGQNYTQAGTGVSLPCALGTASCIGVGTLSRSGTRGIGQNTFQGIYFQDRWRPFSRLTLNLGVRAESEDLPSFNAGDVLAGTAIPGIKQGWGKKIAPRLGGSYDLMGNGKSKIYASYGWFYDRLKFEMPRGSFGGQFFRTDYFPITAAHPNYDYYTPSLILGTWTDPRGGGNPSTTGGLSQLQRDFRIPSNLTKEQFEALGLVVTGVDPDLKSFRQDEFTVGYETELFKQYVFSVRYTNKNVAHAMEDHAILGIGESENYPVGNPGEGLDLALDKANGTAKSAKAKREYNGLEFIFTKRFSNNYHFSANYTLSRLYGNYSGLASSDENGRTSPGVNRFFDYPINGFTATGDPDDGNLPTDRRHTFKAYGGYTFGWWGSNSNTTDFSFFQQILQGTPQTTFVSVVATSIPLSKRGDLGRTPNFWQTDLSLSHRYKFGRDSRYALVFDVNLLNALNNNSVIRLVTAKYRVSNTISGEDIDPNYDADTQTLIPILNKILTGQIGPQLAGLESGQLPSIQGNCTVTPAHPKADATCGRTNPISSLYGEPAAYQGERNIRFGFRFVF